MLRTASKAILSRAALAASLPVISLLAVTAGSCSTATRGSARPSPGPREQPVGTVGTCSHPATARESRTLPSPPREGSQPAGAGPRRNRGIARCISPEWTSASARRCSIAGGLLAIAAALSGLMRGTVLSISVLSVAAGLILAEADAIHVDGADSAVVHLFLLALIVTLFSDGLFVERELLVVHWGPVVRALVIAMPLTLGPAGARGEAALLGAELGGGVPARRGALGDRSGGHLGGGHLAAGAGVGAPRAQSRVGPQRRPRAPVRPLLHHPRLARRRRGDGGGQAARRGGLRRR